MAGVRLLLNAKVTSIQQQEGGWSIHLASGARYHAATVILAASPATAADLLRSTAAAATLRAWAADAIPAKAACLDVGLHRLPRPSATVAFGIDQPLYLSVHSAVAKLAPDGGALIHVAKYLPARQTVASPRTTLTWANSTARETTQAGETPALPVEGPPACRSESISDPQADAREMETLLDLVQPGWRDHLVYRRFLPRMVVMEAIATGAQGGLAGRPGPAVPGYDNLYVAGDWVGPTGMLADAALASARQAAHLALAAGQVARRPIPAGATLAAVGQ
jgi:phytoene dehydrogenase-like protein